MVAWPVGATVGSTVDSLVGQVQTPVGSTSASPTACLLRGYGRAGTQNDRLGEAGHFESRHVHARATDMPSAMPRCEYASDKRGCTHVIARVRRDTLVHMPVHTFHAQPLHPWTHARTRIHPHAHTNVYAHVRTCRILWMVIGRIFASRHRRRHVCRADMGVPVLKMPASPRRSF